MPEAKPRLLSLWFMSFFTTVGGGYTIFLRSRAQKWQFSLAPGAKKNSFLIKKYRIYRKLLTSESGPIAESESWEKSVLLHCWICLHVTMAFAEAIVSITNVTVMKLKINFNYWIYFIEIN